VKAGSFENTVCFSVVYVSLIPFAVGLNFTCKGYEAQYTGRYVLFCGSNNEMVMGNSKF
jgi:hypothetical protein